MMVEVVMMMSRRGRSRLQLHVRVLDHFIVGDGHCSSMAERGLLR